ncbi:unnamed protein product, partial [Effrenium voratum]
EVALQGARLAVRARDVKELHKSLAALLGQGPCAKRVRTWPRHLKDEVLAFRLLYLAHGGIQGHPGRLTLELNEFLKEHRDATGPCLRYARQLRRAQAAGHFARHLALAAEGPPPSDGKSKSALEDCGRLAWTLATHVRRRSVELLARALPHGVDAQRAAESLGLQGPDDLEAWLATEFPNQALLRGDRLDCAKVCACFAEEQAQVAQREEASRRDTELSTFVVSHEEVLKRAEQKKAAKAASKAEKKAKKEKKREKKRAKKEKKRQKKEKKENRTAKKAKPGSSSSSAESVES